MGRQAVRSSCGVALLLVTAGLLALPGHADGTRLRCEGPEGAYEVPAMVSCSEILTAEDAAEQFLDALVRRDDGQTPEELAAALEAEATGACGQRPEKGTVGELLGVDRWGCDAGYTRRNLCQGYVLERIEPLDHGSAVVHQIVVSPLGSGLTYFDAASAVRYKTATGDARIVAGLSYTFDPMSRPPAEYEEAVKAARKGQARAVLSDVLAYCENYKAEYCRTLRSLAARIARPPSSVALEDRPRPIDLVVVATADGHTAAAQPLELSTEDVSLISVSGVVADERGIPIENAQVRFRDWDVVTMTDVHGAFRLSAFGRGGTPVARQVNLTLQRVELSVVLETRPDGGRYVGVASDGVSTLVLALTTRGIQPDSVTVQEPSVGSLRGASGTRRAVPLDAEGRGTLTYVPPSDVATETLTHPLESAALAWAAIVPITFEYKDREGTPGRSVVQVLVCRPPLVVAYPFAADQAAWTAFCEYARSDRFDPTLVALFAAPTVTGSFEEQAELLRRTIADRLRAYALLGIKTTRVDAVAHSLAGLAARRVVEEPLDARTAVRKLLLVATPNHGAGWLERPYAFLTSSLEQHPVAAQELGEDSDFLRRLNAGEATGTHLNPDVQYANISGRRTELRAGGEIGLGAAEDDGFVSTASAHVNGVPDFVIDGVRHSEALPLRDLSIAAFSDVQAKLAALLQQDLPRAAPDDLRLEIGKGGGQVEISPQVWVGSWTRVAEYPVSIRPAIGIRTGKAGYAAVGVFSAEGQWGTLALDEETEVILRSSSPNVLRIQLIIGRARFRSLPSASAGGNSEVVVTAGPASGPWSATRSATRVLGREADFAVSAGDVVTVFSLESRLLVETSDAAGGAAARWVEESHGLRIKPSGSAEDEAVPGSGWWTKSVWREPTPPFRFPLWMLAITLLGLAAAAVYHVRASSRRGERAGSEEKTD